MTGPRPPRPPRLLLVHGWGFDATVWDALAAALPEAECRRVDLGYFGALCPPPPPLPDDDGPVIAVGHSLGVLWLLQTRPCPWAGLVAINGFPRFTEAPDYAPAVPGRMLERMIARFPKAPAAVLAEFRRRCGADAAPPADLDAARLLDGLIALRDWDARAALAGPRLVLSGRDDPILPPGMAEHAFGTGPAVIHHEHPTGGHRLPLTEPAWCAAHLRAFSAGLTAAA